MENYSQETIDRETNTDQVNFIINYFKNKKNGFYIEMGAADGVITSNTYKLEKYYDWNGILIEPIKEYFDKISKYRKTTLTYNICVGNDEGEVEFSRIEGYSKLLSGITNQYPKQHKDRVDREIESMNQILITEKIPCRRLINILNEIGITDIDYLSIDVEGAELSVVKSLSMETQNKIRPILISAENPYYSNEVNDYLSFFGYAKIGRINFDDFFLFNK